MGYSREEQETTLVFDNSTGEWSVYTACPKHITKLNKLTTKLGLELIVVDKDNGRPISVKCKLPEKAISFREPAAKRVLTDEQREELSNRLRNIHSKSSL